MANIKVDIVCHLRKIAIEHVFPTLFVTFSLLLVIGSINLSMHGLTQTYF